MGIKFNEIVESKCTFRELEDTRSIIVIRPSLNNFNQPRSAARIARANGRLLQLDMLVKGTATPVGGAYGLRVQTAGFDLEMGNGYMRISHIDLMDLCAFIAEDLSLVLSLNRTLSSSTVPELTGLQLSEIAQTEYGLTGYILKLVTTSNAAYNAALQLVLQTFSEDPTTSIHRSVNNFHGIVARALTSVNTSYIPDSKAVAYAILYGKKTKVVISIGKGDTVKVIGIKDIKGFTKDKEYSVLATTQRSDGLKLVSIQTDKGELKNVPHNLVKKIKKDIKV
jgi:hypothetical protein